MRAYAAVIIVLTLFSTSSAALAQPPGRAPEAPTEVVTVEETYGLHILAADLAGLTITGLGVATESDALMGTGLVVSALAPMIVHIKHGNNNGAVLSVLLRPGLALAGGMIGAASATCTEKEWLCGFGETMAGAAAGYVTAMAIDALALAHVKRTERRTQWAPQVAVSSGGMRVGIGGTF